jgi:protein involved in polysaccharide export with SLBB domain
MMRVVQLLFIYLLICTGALAADSLALADGYKLQPGDVLQVVVWKVRC